MSNHQSLESKCNIGMCEMEIPINTLHVSDPNYIISNMPIKSIANSVSFQVNEMKPYTISSICQNRRTSQNNGLEYLSLIDQLIVEQNFEMIEVMTGYETSNQYTIKNTMGQTVYFAKECSDPCLRNCIGARRPFTIDIQDNSGEEVMKITRPIKCMFIGHCMSCLKCCKDEIEVQAPVGEVAGYVKQIYEGCYIRYAIQNHLRETVLKLHGPLYCYCHCPGDDIPFLLMSVDGLNEIGKISKQWSNLFKEMFTDADNFGIQFPLDLDTQIKAVVLGAVFLIDFMFFENKGNER